MPGGWSRQSHIFFYARIRASDKKKEQYTTKIRDTQDENRSKGCRSSSSTTTTPPYILITYTTVASDCPTVSGMVAAVVVVEEVRKVLVEVLPNFFANAEGNEMLQLAYIKKTVDDSVLATVFANAPDR